MTGRLGVYILGARGAVATWVIVGARALARELTGTTGLVTERAPLSELPLIPYDHLVLGGCDLVSQSLETQARRLSRLSGAPPAPLIDQLAADLAAADARIRPAPQGESSRRLARAMADVEEFRRAADLEQTIVVALLSTTDPGPLLPCYENWPALEAAIAADAADIPPSVIYAAAALLAGCPYINFTPNPGTELPALAELALRQGLPVAGRDGKTGETLVKTALAPMFAHRNLSVLSWVGQNLLGNDDGRALREPAARGAKIASKSAALDDILAGSSPHHQVDIHYVPSLHDRKVAWDFIHFQGFLATTMSMQFTWMGVDSALAAPLVLDLVRLLDLARRRGERGQQPQLGVFFKSPAGGGPHDLHRQMQALEAWARAAVACPR